MPVSYTYALYPFGWNATTNCHEPPAGSACVIDLRPLSEQAKSGQSSGYGLFAWASGVPGDAVSLGTGYAPELVIDNAARVELRTKLGLAANPSGATLADAMADVLGSLADPTGASMAKPLMPTSDGTLELHMEGHSRIWSAKVDATDLLSANPKGKHNRIRDVIRADLDEAERVGGAPMLQKCLGAWLLKLGVSREELKAWAGGRKAQYDRLMSAAVKAKHGAEAKPRKPETSFAEAWPNASVANINGTTQTVAWVTNSTTMPVVGNRLRGTAPSLCTARCTSAVSSADHWAEVACYNSSSSFSYHAGPLCRYSESAATYYYATRYLLDNTVYLFKYVAGTPTVLGTAAQTGTLAGNVVRVRANGSTISSHYDGAAKSSVTDTSITGNLFGGAYVYPLDAGSQAGIELGAWSIDDGLSGGGASKNILLLRVG